MGYSRAIAVVVVMWASTSVLVMVGMRAGVEVEVEGLEGHRGVERADLERGAETLTHCARGHGVAWTRHGEVCNLCARQVGLGACTTREFCTIRITTPKLNAIINLYEGHNGVRCPRDPLCCSGVDVELGYEKTGNLKEGANGVQ